MHDTKDFCNAMLKGPNLQEVLLDWKNGILLSRQSMTVPT
jgi:hypothetical protein